MYEAGGGGGGGGDVTDGGRVGGQPSGYTSAYPSSQIPEPLRLRSQQAEIFGTHEGDNVGFEKSHG